MKGFSSHSSTYYNAATHSRAGSARAAKGRETDKAKSRNHNREISEICCFGAHAGRISLAQLGPAQLSPAQPAQPRCLPRIL